MQTLRSYLNFADLSITKSDTMQFRADSDKQKIPGKYAVLMQELEHYVLENFDKGLGIKLLARHSNVSESTLRRIFKEYKGETPAVFVQNIRLSRSKELLALGTLTVNEIANAVGYSCNASFTHIFKEKFGCSPTDYQKTFLPFRLF